VREGVYEQLTKPDGSWNKQMASGASQQSFIHSINQSIIQAISIAPLQVHYYSEALPSGHPPLYRLPIAC